MFKDISYRRVNHKDIENIRVLFFYIFKKKISSFFYFKRYFSNNKFNSFIAIYNKKIIGHVAFVKYNYGYDNSIIYSRHSSFVNSKFRKLGVYKALCLFSYKKLILKDKYKIITWPNKLNIKSKPHTNYFFKKEEYYLFKKNFNLNKIKRIYNSRNRLLCNINIRDLNKIIELSKKNSFILSKNYSFLKFRFYDNNLSKHYFDFFSENKKESVIIFAKIKYNNHYIVNILNYFGDDDIFNLHLINLIKKINFNKKYTIQLLCAASNKKNTNFFKNMNFIKHPNIFNIIILSNKNISKNEKKYLLYSEITMADTDVFISLN